VKLHFSRFAAVPNLPKETCQSQFENFTNAQLCAPTLTMQPP
jgi:hypothetical protein